MEGELRDVRSRSRLTVQRTRQRDAARGLLCANGPPGKAAVACASGTRGQDESVTVGGSAWDAFDPKSETGLHVGGAAKVLRDKLAASQDATIVARWGTSA